MNDVPVRWDSCAFPLTPNDVVDGEDDDECSNQIISSPPQIRRQRNNEYVNDNDKRKNYNNNDKGRRRPPLHLHSSSPSPSPSPLSAEVLCMLPQLRHYNDSPSSLSFGGSPARQSSVGSPSSVKSLPLILSSSSSGNNIVNANSSRDTTLKLRRRLEIIKEQRRRSRNNNKSVEKITSDLLLSKQQQQKQQRGEKEDCNNHCSNSDYDAHNIIVQSELMTTKDNVDFDKMEMEMASLKQQQQQQQPQTLLLIDDDPTPSSSPLNISAVSTCRTFDETIDTVDTPTKSLQEFSPSPSSQSQLQLQSPSPSLSPQRLSWSSSNDDSRRKNKNNLNLRRLICTSVSQNNVDTSFAQITKTRRGNSTTRATTTKSNDNSPCSDKRAFNSNNTHQNIIISARNSNREEYPPGVVVAQASKSNSNNNGNGNGNSNIKNFDNTLDRLVCSKTTIPGGISNGRKKNKLHAFQVLTDDYEDDDNDDDDELIGIENSSSYGLRTVAAAGGDENNAIVNANKSWSLSSFSPSSPASSISRARGLQINWHHNQPVDTTTTTTTTPVSSSTSSPQQQNRRPRLLEDVVPRGQQAYREMIYSKLEENRQSQLQLSREVAAAAVVAEDNNNNNNNNKTTGSAITRITSKTTKLSSHYSWLLAKRNRRWYDHSKDNSNNKHDDVDVDDDVMNRMMHAVVFVTNNK